MTAPTLLGGRYELRGSLGRGGMAEVRDGWDRRLGRAVAIKLLYPALDGPEDGRRRFEAEARSAAALNHPHIVAVHDFGEHGGTPFIVMERLPGESLADRIAQGPLPQPLVWKVLDDVLAALAAAHDAGILHRDIKPGNILFTNTGEAKVADFGIAKTAEGGYTVTGQIVGTMGYLSPERVLGTAATVADDLYAVGVVGYEALAGRRPFTQENIGALAHAILHEQPTPIGALRPDADPMLAAVLERAMARDPAWRFTNADSMRAALAGREAVTVPVRPATRVLDSPLPPMAVPLVNIAPPSRKRTVLAGAAVLAAIVLAIFLLALDSTSQTTPPTPTTTSPPASSATPPATTTLTDPPTNLSPTKKPPRPKKPKPPPKPKPPRNPPGTPAAATCPTACPIPPLEIMGHDKVTTTLGICTHLFDDDHSAAMAALGAMALPTPDVPNAIRLRR